jgi:predicted P-loop ATPase
MLNAGMACGLSQSEILATLHSISQNNEVIAYTIAEDTAVAPVKPKKKGRAEVIACAKQFLLSRYKIRFNLMLDRLEYMELATGEWQFIEDRNDNILYNALIDNPDTEYLPKNEYFMIMDVICERYDPLKDWINALPEYTKDYSSIDKLCDMFSLKYDEEEREIFKESVRKWLVASVNTIQTHKSNDLCLIFVGEGGEGKTKVWDKLVASPTYFGCIGDLRDTKDTDLLLSEKHIVLLDELSSSNRKGWEHIKHFITKAASSDRRAYGRRTQQFYRRASFVGSLNEERCLSDLDSNDRRWAIFALTPKITVDFDSITQEFRDDIYAEALMLYKQDYRFWFNNEESTNLLEYKAKYKVIRAEEELLLLHAEPSTTSYKTATQILDLLKKHTSSQLSAIVVGKLLKKLGYQQRRLKGMWVYDIYIKEPDDPSIDRGF